MKRFALLLLLLIWPALVQASEPPACQGTNLLDDLAARDPASHAKVMAEAATTPNGEAILWKIEREGAKPSHLMGTAHVTDPRITAGPPGAEEIIAQSDVVALELSELGDEQAMASAAFKLAHLMVLPPGQSLWDLIPDEHEDLIRNSPSLPPGTVGTLYGYQPWVVAMMMSVPACEQAREASGLKAFDIMIARFAYRKGIDVIGLETMEEQFKAMAGGDMDVQVEFLIESARMSAQATDYFTTLIDLYLQRKITALMPLTRALEPPGTQSSAVYERIETELLLKRNKVMAGRALPLLEKGNAFIAVGALHLPGEEGLVELLRKSGYKVTPVN